MKNIVLGSLLAAVVLFVWGAVAHMLLPLGTLGMQPLPHESSVTLALDLAIDEAGMYSFPWMDAEESLSKDAYADWAEKYQKGPVGLLLFRPEGQSPLNRNQLAIQFATDLVSALLAAVLLSLTRLKFFGRVLFVTGLGLFSWVTFSIPYWNWYGFSGLFTLATGMVLLVGWFLAGLVLAALPAGRH